MYKNRICSIIKTITKPVIVFIVTVIIAFIIILNIIISYFCDKYSVAVVSPNKAITPCIFFVYDQNGNIFLSFL